MYDHIGLKVRNLDASITFYTAALAPLGHVLCSRDDSGAGFGPKDAPALWLHLSKEAAGPGAHVAFRAASHDVIKAFHAAGLKAGGRDNGKPGPREGAGDYYGAFVLDLDGNNIEACCRGPAAR